MAIDKEATMSEGAEGRAETLEPATFFDGPPRGSPPGSSSSGGSGGPAGGGRGPVAVTLQRAAREQFPSRALFSAIRASTEALSFTNYLAFMDQVLAGKGAGDQAARAKGLEGGGLSRQALPFPGVDAYQLVKVATETFLMIHCGVSPTAGARFAGGPNVFDPRLGVDTQALESEWETFLRDPQRNYLAVVARRLGKSLDDYVERDEVVRCERILEDKLAAPCFVELIWSYWQEEGMLAQTINALTWRVQNRRGSAERDPLAQLEIDPLRPLNNLLWGYIQDEQHRLSVARRAYEYDHQYGITLVGNAVPAVRGADSRSKFLEGFHNLLRVAIQFFKQDDDSTVNADGFPVLNALREVHLVLTQGGHNQYGDLPWTARQEMLMSQWLLARPELREFLPRRIMVAYPERWMDSVDAMKTVQGWTDVSVLHFNNLAVYGERLLLAIRFMAWTDPNILPDEAANWARYFRLEVQGYIHAYRAVTGVDLASAAADSAIDATMPALHLKRRLEMQLRSRR